MTQLRRIQLSRAKGWRRPEGAVLVARPTKWGNPWKPGKPGGFWLPAFPESGATIGTELSAEDAVDLYRRLLTGGPDPVNRLLPSVLSATGRREVRDMLRAHSSRIRTDMAELSGRDLCCWCAQGAPCHADVLLELANWR